MSREAHSSSADETEPSTGHHSTSPTATASSLNTSQEGRSPLVPWRTEQEHWADCEPTAHPVAPRGHVQHHSRSVSSASNGSVAAYREDPFIVRLMHEKWARLKHKEQQQQQTSSDADPQQALPDPHLYTYFFAPTPTAPAPYTSSAADETPSTHSQDSLETHRAVQTARRIVFEEEAVRRSPPLAPLGTPLGSPTTPATSLPAPRSCTASPGHARRPGGCLEGDARTPDATAADASRRCVVAAEFVPVQRLATQPAPVSPASPVSEPSSTRAHSRRCRWLLSHPHGTVSSPLTHETTDTVADRASRPWSRLFHWARPSAPERHGTSAAFDAWPSTRTPSYMSESVRSASSDVAHIDDHDSDDDDDDEDDDDELRMMMHSTALSLFCCGLVDCCCDPSTNLFFAASDGDDSEDDNGDVSDADHPRDAHDNRRNESRDEANTAPEYSHLLSPQRACPDWRTRSSPTGSPHRDTSPAVPSSPSHAFTFGSPGHHELLSTPVVVVAAHGDSRVRGATMASPGATRGRCLARFRRSCGRKLRRTWRFMNIFPSLDHHAQGATAETAVTDAEHTSASLRSLDASRRDRDRGGRVARHRVVSEPELSRCGWWFCLLNYAAALCTVLAVLLIVWIMYISALARQRLAGQYDIRDGTVCHALTFKERLRPDLSFSLACFLANSYFLVWCALRAVRLESPGLLLGHALLAVIELSRIVYFVLYVAGRYLVKATDPDAVSDGTASASVFVRHLLFRGTDDVQKPHMTGWGYCGCALLVLAAVLLIASLVLVPAVRRAFGWRSFLHGWTQPADLVLRRRFTSFQTCLQLDGVVTLNVALALVFLLDQPLKQLVNALITCVTWVLLVFLPPLLYRAGVGLRYGVVMTIWGTVLVVSMTFYVSTVVHNLRDFTFDTVSDDADNLHRDPRKSPCYREQLSLCLNRQDMYVVPRQNTSSSESRVLSSLLNSHNRMVADCSAEADVKDAGAFLTTAAVAPHLRAAWRNGTSTFLPTHSALREFVQLSTCPIDTCFPQRGGVLVARYHQCCAGYGVCRLKDAFRTYGVLLVLFLTITLMVVRAVLARLSWQRAASHDDDAIIALRRQHVRGRRHHTQTHQTTAGDASRVDTDHRDCEHRAAGGTSQ